MKIPHVGIRDDRVVELERGVDWRLTAGYDALPAWIGKNLDVRYETKVDKIQWSESGATAFSTTGEEFPARSVICTAPIGVLDVADPLAVTQQVLAQFPAYQTYSDWAWVPEPDWSV